MNCKHCGNGITPNDKFCPNCGSKIEIIHAQQSPAPRTVPFGNQRLKKLCCPNCKSRNLHFQANSNYTTVTKGGGYSAAEGCCGYILFGPLGLLCGACGSNRSESSTTSKNTTVTICGDCAHKFRDANEIQREIDSANEEIKVSKKKIMICLAINAILVLISLVMSIFDEKYMGFMGPTIFGFAYLIGKCIYYAGVRHDVAILMQEKDYIDKNAYIYE